MVLILYLKDSDWLPDEIFLEIQLEDASKKASSKHRGGKGRPEVHQAGHSWDQGNRLIWRYEVDYPPK